MAKNPWGFLIWEDRMLAEGLVKDPRPFFDAVKKVESQVVDRLEKAHHHVRIKSEDLDFEVNVTESPEFRISKFKPAK